MLNTVPSKPTKRLKIKPLMLINNKKGFTIAEIALAFVILCTVVAISVGVLSSGFTSFTAATDLNEKDQILSSSYSFIEKRLRYAMEIKIDSSSSPIDPSFADPEAIYAKDGLLYYKQGSDEPLCLHTEEFFVHNEIKFFTEYNEEKSYLSLKLQIINENNEIVAEKDSGFVLLNIKESGGSLSGDMTLAENPTIFFTQ